MNLKSTNKKSLTEKLKEEKRENMSNSWRERTRETAAGERWVAGSEWLPVK
jgi:hypothetical protein